MARKLLIVESGKKAKTIGKFLGSDWIVKTCFGHVCDLPRKDYGVDKTTFEERYEFADDRQKTTIAGLRKAVKEVGHVYIGTDPDREGEAIAWHLVRLLGLKPGQYSRVEWNEITKALVEKALNNPRDIDEDRVEAQRARRILDRIVGYDVSSEICWPAGAKAAGRVQTPTLHLLCEREREIQNFVPEDYFNLSVHYTEGFDAFVPEEVVEEVLDEATGEVQCRSRLRSKRFATEKEVSAVRDEAAKHKHVVDSVDQKEAARPPLPAYDTAALQKDASSKLGLTPKQTMDHAQALYESGLITYMRTDSTRLSEEAVAMARAHIGGEHPEALSATANTGRAGEQDAHEAIRPTSLNINRSELPAGTAELYDMIVARFLATQCKPAVFNRTTISIRSGPVAWMALGSVLVDPGFLVYWGPYARTDDSLLPTVAQGQQLTPDDFAIEKKRTSPPPRYSAADLVDRMQKSGIGRPATYAATIETLFRHNYIEEQKGGRKKTLIVPTNHGMLLDGLMTATVPALVTVEYTADMEASLDQIQAGKITRLSYLRDWYGNFAQTLADAQPRAASYREEHGLKPRPRGGGGEETDIVCDRCQSSNYLKFSRKQGKGKFLRCADQDCGFIRDVRVKTKKGGCQTCGGNLVERKRRDGGGFFACAAEGCKFTANLDGSTSGGGMYLKPEPTEKTCPRCEKQKLQLFRLRKPLEGRSDFYGCPDRDNCKFTLNYGATKCRVDCDKCGGMMLERVSKKGSKFWGCAKCENTRPMAGQPTG